MFNLRYRIPSILFRKKKRHTEGDDDRQSSKHLSSQNSIQSAPITSFPSGVTFRITANSKNNCKSCHCDQEEDKGTHHHRRHPAIPVNRRPTGLPRHQRRPLPQQAIHSLRIMAVMLTTMPAARTVRATTAIQPPQDTDTPDRVRLRTAGIRRQLQLRLRNRLPKISTSDAARGDVPTLEEVLLCSHKLGSGQHCSLYFWADCVFDIDRK